MTATAPVQKFLPFKVEMKLPMVKIDGARGITGLHENEIKDLIQLGKLVWVWNIAPSFGAGSGDDEGKRRELRFLARELRAFATDDDKPFELDLDRAILYIYGRERPYLLGRDFHRAWNCDSGTAINLLEAGAITKVPGTDYGRGRGNTPCITWASAIRFLQTRRLA